MATLPNVTIGSSSAISSTTWPSINQRTDLSTTVNLINKNFSDIASGNLVLPRTVATVNGVPKVLTNNNLLISVTDIPDTASNSYVSNTYVSKSTPAFIATQTVPQSIIYSPIVVQQMALIYNSVSKNIGSGYNSATGIFTAPMQGFYRVTGSIGVNLGSYTNYLGAGVIGLYYNGIPYAAGPFISAKLNPLTGFYYVDQSTVSTEIYLNVNDQIQCKFAYQTNSTTGYWNTYTNLVPSRFSAVWIHS